MGIIGSLIGGITAGVSTRRTNKTNLQIARETNAANAALAAQQNQWNIEQWERQNEYNSPAHQRDLLLEAGFNPNMYSGQGSTADSLVSAPLANQEAATVNPLPGGLFAELDVLEPLRLELEKKRLQNEIKKTDSEVARIKLDIKQAQAMFPYLKDTAMYQSYSARSQATVDDATTQYRIAAFYLDNRAKETVMKLQKAQMYEIRQRCRLIAAQTDVAKKEAMFKQLELDFSNKFGMPLGSDSGRLVLDYICSSYKTQTEIEGNLSAGAKFGGFGINAGAGAKHSSTKFNLRGFFGR